MRRWQQVRPPLRLPAPQVTVGVLSSRPCPCCCLPSSWLLSVGWVSFFPSLSFVPLCLLPLLLVLPLSAVAAAVRPLCLRVPAAAPLCCCCCAGVVAFSLGPSPPGRVAGLDCMLSSGACQRELVALLPEPEVPRKPLSACSSKLVRVAFFYLGPTPTLSRLLDKRAPRLCTCRRVLFVFAPPPRRRLPKKYLQAARLALFSAREALPAWPWPRA